MQSIFYLIKLEQEIKLKIIREINSPYEIAILYKCKNNLKMIYQTFFIYTSEWQQKKFGMALNSCE